MRRSRWPALGLMMAMATCIRAAEEPAKPKRPVADKPADVYVEDQSGLEFPAEFGQLKRGDAHKYRKPELGVRIHYSAPPSIKADLYIYDAGQKNLGTGADSEAVKSEFEKAKDDVQRGEKQGYYTGVTKVAEEPITLDTASGKLKLLSASFEYSQTKKAGGEVAGKRVPHALLTAYKDHFIKVRFTCPEKNKEAGERALKDLLKGLGNVLK